MPDQAETFITLFFNLPHWEFEVFVSIVFAIVEGLVIWPLWRKWTKHHAQDDDALIELTKRVDTLEHAKTP